MPFDASNALRLTRRDLLNGVAALIVTVKVPSLANAAPDTAAARNLDPTRLDTWLAISADGSVTGYWGKPDMAQGVDTAISQMIAEELDVSVDSVSLVFGDTAQCADQGGASGSTGVQRSGVALQAAAAEARLVLLEKAAQQLGEPLAKLVVGDGVIAVKGQAERNISYARLVGAGAFSASIEWNGEYGNGLKLSGRATPKAPSEYRVVGRSVPRKDHRDKILARTEYLHDHAVPGMLHGRVVRPPRPGARLRGVDRNSISSVPGAQLVVDEDFVGVVAAREWHAIQAADMLRVDWDESDTGFPTDADSLFDWIRATPPSAAGIAQDNGDVDAALASPSSSLQAEYEWPFQSHARMAPAAAIADVRDGAATVWTDSQKPYDTAKGAALLLALPRPSQPAGRRPFEVRSIWLSGPGSYGRSDAGDGAMDAVLLSAAVGKPVRVQWMRKDGHKWDPKGPASVVTCRAAIGAGKVAAYHYHIKGFSRHDQNSREDHPGEVLAGHLTGHASTPRWTMSNPADSYGFANKRYSWEALAPLRLQASPLRTSHFRDPYGPEVHFASESFIDEMAYACQADPVEFRLAHLAGERDADVIRAAAAAAGWKPRTAPRKLRQADGSFVGTGIAYAQRSGSVNAVIAEVEVNADSGRVWVRRFWVGADHGLIVNPFTLERTIEGNLLQATSRTLFEEVRFSREDVTSVDWLSYPILEMADAPLEIVISHINRPELGPQGAGEPTTRVVPAAIANAFFDATGVRLRRVPFTPARVRDALGRA